MTVEQIEITLHHVFDQMELNNYLKKWAEKACKSYAMKKGVSLKVADEIVEHVLH